MNRSRTLAPLALCLALAVGACSGGDEPEAKPTKTTASPTPTVPVQPEGEFGVTYDIQNWDEIAKDEDELEVVLAWKKANEAVGVSTNTKKFRPEVRRDFSKKMQRTYASAFKYSWSRNYKVSETGIVRIASVDGTSGTSTVTACLWKPSTDVRKGSKMVGGLDQSWRKQTAKLSDQSGRWVVQTLSSDAECKGLRAP